MLNAFGRNYEEIGASDKGLILKNSGKVKIQWGNTFIDLLNNEGKLNVKAQKLIKEISSEDEITEDGFYLLNETLKIKSGNSVLEIITDQNTSYISFLQEQTLEQEQKYTALQNIGFLYKNLDDVNIYPTNGIIYNEQDSSLYIVYNGQLIQKYQPEFPNTIEKTLTIKNSDENNAALIIEGEGTQNSILFNSLQIYSNDINSIIDLKGNLRVFGKSLLQNKSEEILQLDNNFLKVNQIESLNGNKFGTFKIYSQKGEYYLDIDYLNVKKEIQTSQNITPTRVYGKENVIIDIEQVYTENVLNYYILNLKYKNEYNIGDILRFYINFLVEESSEGSESSENGLSQLQIFPIECTITKVLENAVKVQTFNCDSSIDFSNFIFKKNILCYLIQSNSIKNKDLIIGELNSEDKYKNGINNGIVSKQNIFYSANFKKETGASFSYLNYPHYDSELTADLSNNITENNISSLTANNENILVPMKFIKDLYAKIEALESRVTTLERNNT